MEPTTPTTERELPTDRDILIAVLNLVGALAERMTGERPTVCVYYGDNQFVSVTPTTSVVSWAKPVGESAPPAARGE